MESPTVSPDGRPWSSGFHYIVLLLSDIVQLLCLKVSLSWWGSWRRRAAAMMRWAPAAASDVNSQPTHIAANTHRPVWPPTSCIQVATQLMRSLSSSAPICALVDSVLRRQSSAQQFTHGRDLTANESVCGLALLSVLHAIRAATDASVSRTITLYARI